MVVADVRTVVATGILQVEGEVADTKVVSSEEEGIQVSAGRGFVVVVAAAAEVDTDYVAAEVAVVETYTSSVVVGHTWSAGAEVTARLMLRMANWSYYPTSPTQHKDRVGASAEVEVVERRSARVVESRIGVAEVAGGRVEVVGVAECRTGVVEMVGCRIAEVGVVGCRIVEAVEVIERRTAKVVDVVGPAEMGPHRIGFEAVQDLTNCIGFEKAEAEARLSANGRSLKQKTFRYPSAGNEGAERVGEEGAEEAGAFPLVMVVRN